MSPTIAAVSDGLNRNNQRRSATETFSASRRHEGTPDKPNQVIPSKSSISVPPMSSAHVVSGKKRMGSSPFRIKAGCLVALRYRSGGNRISMVSPSGKEETLRRPANSYAEVWTDPLPGRDEGLALIGRRVRCCFPKSLLSSTGTNVGTSRILEGEIISLVDYETEYEIQRKRRQRRKPYGTRVELLVDREILSSVTFLTRSDEAVDVSMLSDVERKRHRFEEIIRGKNKVTVMVVLSDASGISVQTDNVTEQQQHGPIAKWVIRKRIPLPITALTKKDNATAIKQAAVAGETKGVVKKDRKKKKGDSTSDSLMRYMGDGNDSHAQQETNWRWLSGRYDDILIQKGISKHPLSKLEELSFGFIGEVLRVTPTLSPASSSTLAMVTLRRLLIPEHSRSGRRPHHGPFDVFDDADSCIDPNDANSKVNDAAPYRQIFQVPVEELVIISRRLERRYDSKSPLRSTIDCGWPIVTATYSLEQDMYAPLLRTSGESRAHATDSDDDTKVLNFIEHGERSIKVCHRCRWTTNGIFSKRQISKPLKDNCVELGWFCEDCIRTLQTHGKAKTGCRWGSACDCRTCSSAVSLSLQSALKDSAEDAFDLCFEEDNVASKGTSLKETRMCRVCCRFCKVGTKCGTCGFTMHPHCSSWDKLLDGMQTLQSWMTTCPEAHDENKNENGADDNNCRFCRAKARSLKQTDGCESLTTAFSAIHAMRPIDFDLPPGFMEFNMFHLSSGKPLSSSILKVHKKTSKKGVRKSNGAKSSQKGKALRETIAAEPSSEKKRNENEVDSLDECSRLIPYDPARKRSKLDLNYDSRNDSVSRPHEMLERISRRVDIGRAVAARQVHRKRVREADRDEKKTTSRAARANQRRMMKGVAAIGASSLGLDALAGREQQLRFDRSNIHAWGVFADEDINAGDMIVEYRGELIGNAVAEKREKEYEMAKIGSDYMFRIDAYTVCDATKQGNVARFINASCDPNCYTQIISLNGTKRIVIYAKKDIQAGEELCYDYKFPFEFDEVKRIRCYCGTQDCRGFMNWDKRYVVLPTLKQEGTKQYQSVPII